MIKIFLCALSVTLGFICHYCAAPAFTVLISICGGFFGLGLLGLGWALFGEDSASGDGSLAIAFLSAVAMAVSALCAFGCIIGHLV